MGVVRAFLAMEARFRIAPAALSRRLARTVLRLDALYRGPGLDQRAIFREVIAPRGVPSDAASRFAIRLLVRAVAVASVHVSIAAASMRRS